MTRRPNVILIVMDTVRADHLSCFGYNRKTTPNIDKIARQGILFENTYSASIWSPPSHASIFTGKYPSHHKTLGRNVSLSKNNTTIAQALAFNGYRTIGISNCLFLWPGSGFDKGFQDFVIPRETTLPSIKSRAADFGFILCAIRYGPRGFIRTLASGPDNYTYYSNDMIKTFLKRNQSHDRSFFLFVNYFNCHAPYNPPRPFKEKFCEDFYEPKLYILEFLLEKIFGATGQRISNPNLDIKKLKYIAGGDLESRFSFMAEELQVSKKEWDVILSWYDGEIAYLDHCIGDLMKFLYDEGLFENTLIVITSDHGENFGEHGLAGHNYCLYDSLLHIPLIMSYPAAFSGKERKSEIVSSIDIFPTIMSICNINIKDDIQGKSLIPLKERTIHNFVCAEVGKLPVAKTGMGGVRARHIFSRLDSKLGAIDVGFKCVRDEAFKYILSAKGEEQLYDFSKDPQEKKNLISELPKKAKELRSQMEKIVNVNYFGPKEISGNEAERKEIMNRLRALGYI